MRNGTPFKRPYLVLTFKRPYVCRENLKSMGKSSWLRLESITIIRHFASKQCGVILAWVSLGEVVLTIVYLKLSLVWMNDNCFQRSIRARNSSWPVAQQWVGNQFHGVKKSSWEDCQPTTYRTGQEFWEGKLQWNRVLCSCFYSFCALVKLVQLQIIHFSATLWFNPFIKISLGLQSGLTKQFGCLDFVNRRSCKACKAKPPKTISKRENSKNAFGV